MLRLPRAEHRVFTVYMYLYIDERFTWSDEDCVCDRSYYFTIPPHGQPHDVFGGRRHPFLEGGCCYRRSLSWPPYKYVTQNNISTWPWCSCWRQCVGTTNNNILTWPWGSCPCDYVVAQPKTVQSPYNYAANNNISTWLWCSCWWECVVTQPTIVPM